MAKWTAFPYDNTAYSHDAAALKKHWSRLHAGDAEALPKDDKVLAAWSLGRRFNCFAFVSGNSMAPTLHAGQFVRLTHMVPADIERGTIVVMARPGECLSIKRVIGLPNETIAFDRGEVFVNGRMLYEPYLLQCVTTFSWECQSLATKKDQYVLMGDNRLLSEDSRQYGVIPRGQIIALIEMDCAVPEMLDRPHYRITRREDAAAERYQSQAQETSRAHDTL